MRIDFGAEHFKIALATSVVVFGFDGLELKVLLANKNGAPYDGAMIIPSSVVKSNESTEDVAKELLHRVTGRGDWPLEKLNGYDEPYRNPSGRVINIAWYCTVEITKELKEDLRKPGYEWVSVYEIPNLAYDHNQILDYARERLKRRVKRRPIGFAMLPSEFTLTEIQRLYESALQKPLDKRNFQRKLLKSELLIELDRTRTSSPTARRPAKLYRFDENKYRKMTLRGYDFVYQ